MNAFDHQRLLTALILLVMALVVASGSRGLGRWRRQLRGIAIIAFLIAVVLALAEIGVWWLTAIP